MWWKRRSKSKVIGCSNCFYDVGLCEVARKLSKDTGGKCPKCGSLEGAKFTKSVLEDICSEYFVRGSIYSGKGWFTPLIQFNCYDRPIDEIGREPLKQDIRCLSESFGIRVFLYGPPLWAFGKPCEEDGVQHWTDADFQLICEYHTEQEIGPQTTLYRVQTNIEFTPEDARFCSPPDEYRTKFGRFDSANLPVHYSSFDVETCLHESRISLNDEIYVATMQANRKLKILNLALPKVDFDISLFEDPRIWLRSLIYDYGSYKTCRKLASHIHALGYDGFIVKSYFQQVATKEHLNLCLFGRPIVAGLLAVKGVNRVNLHNISYEYEFGPGVFNDQLFEEPDELIVDDHS